LTNNYSLAQLLYASTRYMSTSININQIASGYFSVDSMISRDHIFSSTVNRCVSGCFTSMEKRRMFQSGDKSHTTWSKKKFRFYPWKICRVMDSDPFVRWDCAYSAHAAYFFFHQTKVGIERKAEKRVLKIRACILTFDSFPSQCVIVSVFRYCDFSIKKSPFFRITSITAVLFHAFVAYMRCTVLIASFFSRDVIHIQ
jgi:hypothetical protein